MKCDVLGVRKHSSRPECLKGRGTELTMIRGSANNLVRSNATPWSSKADFCVENEVREERTFKKFEKENFVRCSARAWATNNTVNGTVGYVRWGTTLESWVLFFCDFGFRFRPLLGRKDRGIILRQNAHNSTHYHHYLHYRRKQHIIICGTMDLACARDHGPLGRK